MEIASIRPFTHKHCRFRLRNGREIYGVVWEVETSEETDSDARDTRLFFASVRDYERLQLLPHDPVSIIDMHPEEIINAESLAS
ncbi:MAG: hypothetical protein IT231_01830 [Flavobacteriales bacterium]|jgi:hypothetical protein|nr:hypothetical protein [Flavobacteriales bacterium]